jgi:hypothetical protein
VACRVLTVSRSGYYDWLGRSASLRDQENEYLLKQITQVHADSRETYGSLRVHAELTLGVGLSVTLKRVTRLLRAASIQGLYRRRRRGCTLRDPAADPSSDLVHRQFTVDKPNRLWVTGYHRAPHRGRHGILRGRDGRLFPAHRRLVHCRVHAHRTRHRRARPCDHRRLLRQRHDGIILGARCNSSCTAPSPSRPPHRARSKSLTPHREVSVLRGNFNGASATLEPSVTAADRADDHGQVPHRGCRGG